MNPTYKKLMRDIERGDQTQAFNVLQDANNAYYGGGDSVLTDAEFDEASGAYAAMFGAAIRTAPTVKRGRGDRHAGVQQDYPLLANWLAKAHAMGEVHGWLDKSACQHDILVGSPKYDGMSIVVSYHADGRVKRALTRGDDGLGVDVTRLFEGETHWASNTFGGDFGVKYEIVMRWQDLEALNESMGDSGKVYKNPRNTVAGIVGSDDSRSKRSYLTLAVLDAEWDGMPIDRIDRLEVLDGMMSCFTANSDHGKENPWLWAILEDRESLDTFYQEMTDLRLDTEYGFMLDGIVIEIPSEEDIVRLGGRVSDCPDYAIALKFPQLTARTTAVAMEWDTGNTGRKTPVVRFEPVSLLGNTYSRTSISNMTRFDALKLAPGTPLIFELRGDILGWLDRGGPDPEGAVPFPDPTDVEFTFNKEGKRVFAYAEAPLAGRVERMMVKMNVKGVRIQQITKLVEAGLITKLSDIFTLDLHAVASLPGFGQSSADMLCNAVAAKLEKGLWDWEILASVGIIGVGRSLSKVVLRAFTLEELVNTSINSIEASSQLARLTELEGIETERAFTIARGVERHKTDILELCSLGNVLSTKEQASQVTDGQKYKVVVTGDLVGWDRDTFKEIIEAMGHKMVGSVSSKTDFLITNEPNSGTVKIKKAIDLGIPVLSEAEALPKFGLTPQVRPSAVVGTPQLQEGSLDEL